MNDSRIVNIAGRQRMLSQKILKEALILEAYEGEVNVQEHVETLARDLEVFSKTHDSLQFDQMGLGNMPRNNVVIDSLFREIDQDKKQLVHSSSAIIKAHQNRSSNELVDISDALEKLMEVEGRFLLTMDAIVNVYDSIGQEKVKVCPTLKNKGQTRHRHT